jgi:hemerythrin
MGNAYFPWKDEYSFKIPIIDSQHKEIITFVNMLINHVTGDEESEIIFFKRITEPLVKLLMLHFISEEELMIEQGYPEYERHKQKHDTMFFDIEKTIENILIKKQKLDPDYMKIHLRDLFIDHVVEEDEDLRKFILQNVT